MKRKELIKILRKNGCILRRHGKKHDIYENPLNGRMAPIPRHNEIKESLVLLILKQLDIEK